MKRDMEVVREILLAIEEHSQDPRLGVNLKSPNHTPEQVSYHVMILQEAGLIEAQDFSSSTGFYHLPKRLTWAGHEFLDAARNDTVWNKTKETVKEKGGSIPFEVLKVLLMKAAMSFFGVG